MPLSSWPAVTPSAATSRAVPLSVANCAASAMSATASRFAGLLPALRRLPTTLRRFQPRSRGLHAPGVFFIGDLGEGVATEEVEFAGEAGIGSRPNRLPPPPPARPLLDVPPRGDMRGIEPKESERCRRCSSILAIPPSLSRHGDRFLTPFSAMCVNSSPKTRGGGARAAGGITPMLPSLEAKPLPRVFRAKFAAARALAT